MDSATIPGLYGKIPVRGDFVTRRLTPRFIEVWDQWLQTALSASKEQLDTRWLEIYLTSPIWHFALSAGICGDTPWTGILIPSVDKVGRYFPLTFAVAMRSDQTPYVIFKDHAEWFARMERLALSVLKDNLDLPELDQALQSRSLPKAPSEWMPEEKACRHFIKNQGRMAFDWPMDEADNLSDAFAKMGICLLADTHATYSIWQTPGSDTIRPWFRVYDSLPPREAFQELLIGHEKVEDTVSKAVEPQRLEEDPPTAENSLTPTTVRVDRQQIQWSSCAGTTTGKVRSVNEDAYLECPEVGLWAVADGMGGHCAGDVASQAAIDALGTLVGAGNLDTYASYTTACLRAVNAQLLEMSGDLGDDHIIGSTVVVMLAVGEACAALWAGDSRLYQMRDGTLTQLTRDHSLDQEVSPEGLPHAHAHHPEYAGNIVTRALGADTDLRLDRVRFQAEAGDRYLLCSDGLPKEVDPGEIAEIMNQYPSRTGLQKLIDTALERGARDNVTVVMAQAEQLG